MRTWLLATWVAAALVGAGCREDAAQRGRAALELGAESLELGMVPVGSTRTVELSLTNASRVPVRIYELTSSTPSVSAPGFEPFELVAGETRTLSVRFAPGEAGWVDAELTLAHDDGGDPKLIPVSGEGVDARALVDTAAIDFGRVPLERTASRSITVRNPSELEVIARIALPGGRPFSSAEEGVEVVLPPHEARTIGVDFRPLSLGEANGVAVVHPCGGCEPTQIALLGQGIVEEVDIFPTTLDFGRIPVGAAATQTVSIQNLGSQGLRLSGAMVLDAPEGTFTVDLGAAASSDIAPRQIRQFTVRFAPKDEGAVQGAAGGPKLQVTLQTVTGVMAPALRLLGEGGPSCLRVVPGEVDFGEVPEGMTSLRRVELMNRCPHEVTIVETDAQAQTGGFFSVLQSQAGLTVPSGARVPINVGFSPKAGVAQSAGLLAIKVEQGSAIALEQVPLKGRSRAFPPCVFQVAPGTLDFGSVAVGTRATLGVTLTNAGSDACYVGGGQLTAGSDPAFSVDWQPSMQLAPGKSVTWKVHFEPASASSFSGQLEAWVSHPTQSRQTALVMGKGVQSCVTLSPAHATLGLNHLGCAPKTVTITAHNGCPTTAMISGAVLETPSSSELKLSQAPALPYPLGSGKEISFEVAYAPQNEGADLGALKITAAGITYTATVEGSASADPMREEQFAQALKPKVDVLFVIDNSASMLDEQEQLGSNFAAFLAAAQQHQADYQIGVTTTGIGASPGSSSTCPGGAMGGEAGRLFPVDGSRPRIITPLTPNAGEVFAENVSVGACHWMEQGLEAAYLALSAPLVSSADAPSTSLPNDGNAGFLRPDAKLALVFVTDEEDFSPRPVSFYEGFFRSLKGNDASRWSVSAIVGPNPPAMCATAASPGARYLSLVQAMGGAAENICSPDWAQTLEDLGRQTFSPRSVFELAQVPSDPAQLAVELDGVPVTQGWSYDAARNAVVFEAAALPPPGALIDVRYPVGC